MKLYQMFLLIIYFWRMSFSLAWDRECNSCKLLQHAVWHRVHADIPLMEMLNTIITESCPKVRYRAVGEKGLISWVGFCACSLAGMVPAEVMNLNKPRGQLCTSPVNHQCHESKQGSLSKPAKLRMYAVLQCYFSSVCFLPHVLGCTIPS